MPGGEIWLNATIALASCVEEEHQQGNAPIADPTPSQSIVATIAGSSSSAAKASVLNAGLGFGAILMLSMCIC